MLKFSLVLMTVISIIILVAIIGLSAFCIKGGTSIVIPGFGIVVSGSIFLCFLIFLEIITVALTAYLVRYSFL